MSNMHLPHLPHQPFSFIYAAVAIILFLQIVNIQEYVYVNQPWANPSTSTGDRSTKNNNNNKEQITFCNIQVFNVTSIMPPSTNFRVNLASVSCQLERPSPYSDATTSHADSPILWTPFVHFQLMECPIAYETSTFRLSANSGDTHFMGTVGPRVAVKEGCGIYHAKVPAVAVNITTVVHIEWTSHRREYSNRLADVLWAFSEKKLIDNTSGNTDIADRLTEDRLDYLQNHLESIPAFRFIVQPHQTDHVSSSYSRESLPDCSQLPVPHWAPVGVIHSTNTFHLSQDEWPFASSRCNFGHKTLDELNDQLRGMRVKYVMDSHGEFMSGYWSQTLCPDLTPTAFFDQKYNCPNTTQDFVMAWRFFRAVYSEGNFTKDFDGLSDAMRHGEIRSCKDILGLGLYNATIIAMPTWIYVYETKDGLDHILTSMESMLHNCKATFPDLYKNHIVLIQTTTAVDSNPISALEDAWRGIHNYNIEAMATAVQERLGPLVDGIIPMFELTYAKLQYVQLRDAVHFHKPVYGDLAQIQASAVISAMKTRDITCKGDPRWFAGVALEDTHDDEEESMSD